MRHEKVNKRNEDMKEKPLIKGKIMKTAYDQEGDCHQRISENNEWNYLKY